MTTIDRVADGLATASSTLLLAERVITRTAEFLRGVGAEFRAFQRSR